MSNDAAFTRISLNLIEFLSASSIVENISLRCGCSSEKETGSFAGLGDFPRRAACLASEVIFLPFFSCDLETFFLLIASFKRFPDALMGTSRGLGAGR